MRGGSTLVALEIGAVPPSEGGFRLVGAHTDSPNLRVKPRGEAGAQGVRQIAVEPYGGVLLHTWLDRDLSLAGRVLVRRGGTIEPVLIRIDDPIARVASLAIHLHRKVNEEGLVLNKQTHMAPHLALEGAGDHTVVSIVAEAAKVEPKEIYGHDLCLYDVAPPRRGGAHGELIFAPRLDNLGSCHAATVALTEADGGARATRGFILYDHEECGSRSPQGADSPFLAGVLERVSRALDDGADAPARRAQPLVPDLGGHGARGPPELGRPTRAGTHPDARRGSRREDELEPALRDRRGERGALPRLVRGGRRDAAGLRHAQRPGLREHDRADHRGSPRGPHGRRRQPDALDALVSGDGGRGRTSLR